jgi:hypothetical protein
MAQIIKHRRGSLEALSAVTSSLQKGEIVIASGSSNLSVTNGASIVFAVPENGQVQAVNRFLVGANAPNTFPAGTYNGLVKGVPYYASGSSTLYLLGEGANEIPNLVGNIQPFSTSVDSRLDSLESSIGGGTGIGARVSALEATSASLNSFTQSFSSSVATSFSASAASLTSYSSSAASAQNTYSSSVATSLSSSVATINANILTLSTSVDSRLDAVENTNATQATTGSNIFIGNQTITGSVFITQNLVVQGSSSLQNITASAVDIGTNIVELNTATPAVRFGGVSVQDSGSFAGVSGSLFWDSFNNNWLYVQPSASGEGYNSAILIAGPMNTGSLGSEIGITTGYIPVAVGANHIGDSNITKSGTEITIAGSLKVTGEISGSTIAGLGNAAAFSTSVDSRLDSVEASLGGGGSIGSRVTNLEAHSASIATWTGSTFVTFSTSVDSRLDSVELVSASAAAALNSFSASNATTDANQTTNITAVFASASAYSASAAVVDAAQDVLITSLRNNVVSASVFTTFSTSVDSRLDSVELVSASAASALNSVSGTFATTISNLGSTYATDAELSAVSSAVATTITNLGSTYATDAELSSVSSAVATTIANLGSTYATDAELSSFSSSNALTDATQSANITTATQAAAGAFASASAYSASAAVVDAAQDVLISSLRTNILSASVFTTFSTSVDTRLDTLEATTFSTSVDARLDVVEASASKIDTAISFNGTNVTVNGNLTVSGTTTAINSTEINIGDNIIYLNGTGAANGGIYVKDPTAPTTGTGSIVWDSTGDFWKAGLKDSEYRILTVNDGIVSGSSQITISSTTGYSTYSSSVATSISASSAAQNLVSASFATTIGNLGNTYATDSELSNVSGAFATTISNLGSTYATDAELSSVSGAVATSLSASSATTTALSSSLSGRVRTLEGTGTIQGVGTTNNVTFNSVTASLNLGSTAGSTKRIAFRNTNGTLDLVPTASVDGDLLQWNGSDFVMSNTIDGGSF